MTFRQFMTFDTWQRGASDTLAYARSFFDDPVANGKGSMARLCAYSAFAVGMWTIVKTVQFAFAALATKTSETGMLGILAGLATTCLATVCYGLLTRKKADGSTEAVNDELPTPAAATTTVVNVDTSTGGAG